MKKIYFLLLVILISSSCKTKKETKSKINTDDIEFVKLLDGSHSNFKEKDYIVINSEKELQIIYATINSTRRPGFEIPKIDFKKEQVIGLFLGTKTYGGYSVKVDRISKQNNEILVFFTENKPSGITTCVMTQPFYLAKMNKTTKSVKFIEFK